MALDPRDEIWNAAYFTWYDSAFNLEVATRMVDRLKTLDDVTKVLVALTASTVVAGWSLWSKPGIDILWPIIAGLVAILSIIHGSLGISGRLKEWLETKRDFSALEVDLKSFRYKMRIDPDFDIKGFQEMLDSFRKKYGELVSRIPSDFFATKSLRATCQENVNAKLLGRTDGKPPETRHEQGNY